MERKFQFVEPLELLHTYNTEPVVVTVSRSWIISMYFKTWAEYMANQNKINQITYENCIDDFCVTHWAVEL